MKRIAILCFVLFCATLYPLAAQPVTVRPVEIVPAKDYRKAEIANSPALQPLLQGAVDAAIAGKNFKPGEIAATLIDLRDPAKLSAANVNGDARIYPASVVKMFYLVALHRQMQDGKITLTPELERGISDMIVVSSNEATQYILDVLTDTSSGGEMLQREFEIWASQRNRVNRYYTAMGYTNINVNQKTFCEDAYGREQQFRNYKSENRNMLTTNATARLMAEIVMGRVATPERTKLMMDLMKRTLFTPEGKGTDPAPSPAAPALIDKGMKGASLWSKSGGTSRSLHDAVYIETPEGLKFVLAVFTENHVKDADVIPAITGKIIDGLKK